MTSRVQTLVNDYCDAGPWDGDLIDVNIPECTHPEHWQQVVDDGTGWLDWDDAPAVCRWNQTHQFCDLDAGHDGPHHWPGLTIRVPVIA